MSPFRAITNLISLPMPLCVATLCAVATCGIALTSGPLSAEPIRLTVDEADYAPDRPLVYPAGYRQADGRTGEVERISIYVEEDPQPVAPASWRPAGERQTARPPEPPPITENEGDPPLKIYRVRNGNLVDPEGPQEPRKVPLAEKEATPIPPQYTFRPPGSQAETQETDSGLQLQPSAGRRATVRLAPVVRAQDLEGSADEETPRDDSPPQFTIGDSPQPAAIVKAPVDRAPATSAPATSAPVPQPPAETPPLSEPPRSEPPAEEEMFDFYEVEPRQTTIDEIRAALGEPSHIEEQDEAPAVYIYQAPMGYARVEVVVVDRLVESVFVVFTEPRPFTRIASELNLSEDQSAKVLDEVGLSVGTVYPERGILLVRVEGQPEDTAIESVIIQSPVAEAFLLRAQDRHPAQVQDQLADLRQAVRLDPEYGEAWWHLAEALDRSGAKTEALEAIEKAVQCSDGGPEAQLTYAVMQAHRGNYSASIARIREIAEDTKIPPQVRARAYCALGDLLQLGGDEKNRQAIEDHLQAVQLAAQMVNDPQLLPRRAAKRVLIDAHLGLAVDVAAGPWDHQEEAVAKWLEQADHLIHDLIENEEATAEWNFRRLRRGLVAHSLLDSDSSVRGLIDPIETLGQQLIRESGDPAYRQIIEWEIGQSMIQAFYMAYTRQDHQEALAIAEGAHRYYLAARNHRKLSIADTMMLANLYFRAGAFLALEKEDHTAALTWYGRAEPLLTTKEVAHLMHERRGESLVSMAVSYWESGQKEEAVRLTEEGLEILQAGVDRKSSDPQKLQVPLANLSKMHRELGDGKKSAEYSAARRKIAEGQPERRNPLR